MFWKKKRPKPGNLPPGAPHARWGGPMLDPRMWNVRHDLMAKTGNAGMDLRLEESARGLLPRLKGESFSFPVGSDGLTESFRFEQRCQFISGNHPGNHQCIWSHHTNVFRFNFRSGALMTHLLEARQRLQNDYLSHLLLSHSPAMADARMTEIRENVLEGGCMLVPDLPTAGEVAGDPEGKLGLPEEPEREKECSYCGLTSEDVMHIPCIIKAKEEGVDNIFPVTEAWNRRQIEKMNAEFAKRHTTGFASAEHELLAAGFSLEDIERMKERQGVAGLATDGSGNFYISNADGLQKIPAESVERNPDGTYKFVLQAGFYPNGRGSPGFQGTVSQDVNVEIIGKHIDYRENGGG